MLRSLGKRAIDLTVVLFAVLGFASVPLGEKTGLEHVRSILSSPQAQQAKRDIITTLKSLREQILPSQQALKPRRTPRSTELSSEPSSQPKPIPPRLPAQD